MSIQKRHHDNLVLEYTLMANGHKFIDTLLHLPVLRLLARGVVAEIGTDVGNSTTALLLGVEEQGGHLYSIDPNPECATVYAEHQQWLFINCKSEDAVNLVPPEIDVLYIDGDHSYEAVRNDLALYGHRVKKVILMHDVDHPDYPGVRRAFLEYPGSKQIFQGSWGLGLIWK